MTRWKRIGECRRCGDCCRMDILSPDIYAVRNEEVKRQYGKPLNPACAHLGQSRTGRAVCLIYEDRSPGCREFPRVPMDVLKVPNCGYDFVPDRKVRTVKRPPSGRTKRIKRVRM